ncbi:unnamed protein product [Phaedon cochleariae]|uniref:ethanolamine kinase n=1 Tax=Phaedon cochleariae TaxID=80249 RepID=A0A9P0DLY5_PHACE|nr:unnamed protein product [Phaedon cochleariae]
MNFETKLHVPFIDVTIDENNIQEGALEVLKIIRPRWKQDTIRFKLLTDGITNKLVGCKPEDADEEETVLVRVYGNKTDLLIDREAETRNIMILNKAGLSPHLYATYRNGLAYRYVPGNTLTSETVMNPSIYELVARRLALVHRVNVNGVSCTQPIIWDKLKDFLNLVPDSFSDNEKNMRYLKNVTHKSEIVKEANELRPILEELNSPIVFAHNDLLLGNIIFTESKNVVTFIDYEYAAHNYQAFDIANHFAEFAGLNSILDYSKYPNKEFQERWLRIYLNEFNGTKPSKKDIEILYVQVNKFVLLSHIFWGIWALIQAEHSYIVFDYMGYATTRFNEYFRLKNDMLSLELPV